MTRFSSPRAVLAANRVFSKLNFVGMTKAEVLNLLGDPATISDYGVEADSRADAPLIYKFDTGEKDDQYTVHFADGKVQKVGFRKWLIDLAQTNGTDGWVRNRSDGSLEAVLKGDRNQVGQVILQCHEGPRQGPRISFLNRRSEVRVLPGGARVFAGLCASPILMPERGAV